MKNVLIVHNRYKQYGGEDAVVDNEIRLLKEMGYKVYTYIRTNDELDSIKGILKIFLPIKIVFSLKTYTDVRKIISRCDIDILHVHNTLAVISPSVYYAGFGAKIPTFQTIHNFRFMCPGALFLRESELCTECIDNSLCKALEHRCYRNSFFQTLAVAMMLYIHRVLGTYNRLNYICLSEFNKEQIMKLNTKLGVKIKESQIFVKPNFVDW